MFVRIGVDERVAGARRRQAAGTVRPVIGEFEQPLRLRSGQDRALARYVREQVAPFSAFHAPVLRSHTVTGRESLAELPVVALSDVVEPAALVLRPTSASLAVSPNRLLQAAVVVGPPQTTHRRLQP